MVVQAQTRHKCDGGGASSTGDGAALGSSFGTYLEIIRTKRLQRRRRRQSRRFARRRRRVNHLDADGNPARGADGGTNEPQRIRGVIGRDQDTIF